jgi:long-chain fatty acid transport protein
MRHATRVRKQPKRSLFLINGMEVVVSSKSGINRRQRVAAMLCLLVAASSPIWAGGIYLYEKSATDVGLGSAGWTARADDGSTIFSNPAGLTRLEGKNFEFTLLPLYLNSEFTPDPMTTTVTGTNGDASDWLPLGGAFYSQQLSDTVTFGVGVGGYFGLAIEYESSWVGRYYVQDTQLQAVTIEPAVGIRVSEHWSLGIGVAAHYGIFNQTVAINNTPIFLPGTSGPDGELKIDTTDWTFQGNLGVLWEGEGGTRVGLQYLTSADLEFSDVPEFNGLRPALEAALSVAGVLDTKLDIGIEMPQAVRIGFHSGLGESWRVMGDVGWEEWSKFGKLDILLDSDDSTQITANRNYEDVWHVALGAQHDLSDSWEFDFGVAYDSSMVDDEDRTPDLAVGEVVRLGVGAKYQSSESSAWVFAYEAGFSGDLPMAVNRGPLAGAVAGEYEGVTLHFLAVTWRKSF